MASFASEPMSDAMREKLSRKYAPGSLITFKAVLKSGEPPTEIYARVVEEIGEHLSIEICNDANDYCENRGLHNRFLLLPKINVVCLKRTMFASGNPITLEGMAACAAGGAKKKSRRRKANKASKTKRKSRRLKRTSKRRA